jgi:hypothetical protein
MVMMALNSIGQVTIISSDQTWTTNQNPANSIIIKPGVTLTINSGVTVDMPLGSYIQVDQGASLVANGATFTSTCSYWLGIVSNGLGNNYDQVYFLNPNNEEQPLIQLTGCTVSKMTAGIQNANFGANNTSGGILKIKECTFI